MKFRSSFLCQAVSRGRDDGGMTSTTRIQRKYDHRLRELVFTTSRSNRGDAEAVRVKFETELAGGF